MNTSKEKYKTNKHQTVDILILHGLDNELVNDIKSFFTSLDLSSATVLNLASLKKTQNERVDFQIKNCDIPLVVATFDEEEKNSNKARPNIYDEIARCQTYRPKETIVLREVKGTKRLDLPSNVEGQLVIIEFEKSKLHQLFPRLITELKGRNFLSHFQGTGFKERFSTGAVLSNFLDEMDDIWEKEFDIASNNIERNDWFTENKFQVTLDKFFLEYWKVFNALIREKKKDADLKDLCDSAVQNSYGFAAEVWESVADARIKSVEDLKIKKSNDKRFDNQSYDKYFNIADKGMRDAKRKHITPQNRIKSLRDAIENLNTLIRKVILK